jgi:serine/threonine protein kinase
MPDPNRITAPDEVTCDTLAGLSATKLDIPLAPPIEVGDIGCFAGYRVVRQIGSGGMGLVYEAVDPRLERTVALKVLKPRYAANARAMDRFLAEGRAAAAIVDDHVVTIYQVHEAEGLPFLTMELLTGCSLQHQTQGKAVPQTTAARVAREIATGLRAVHAAKLVHRDVKPENVWLDARTGRVKLLDFGLALRPADLVEPVEGLTGTPAYMAPEQVGAEAIDHRSDLFSLGVVLYEMLAGERPFQGGSIRDVLTAIRSTPARPVTEVQPDVSARLARLTHHLLEKNPADRPPSADAVIQELIAIETLFSIDTTATDGLIEGWPEIVERPTPAPRRAVRPRQPDRRPLYLGLVALAAVLVALPFVLNIPLLPKSASSAPAPPPKKALPKAAPVAKVTPPVAKKARTDDTWYPLFSPGSLAGWTPARGSSADAWWWEDGVLRGKPDKVDDVLLSDREYGDFELKLDYRWRSEGGHTSVMFRCRDLDTRVDGIEVNVGDDENFPKVHGRPIGANFETGSIYNVKGTTEKRNKLIGEWNNLRILSQGQVVQVDLNGTRMVEVDLNAVSDEVRKAVPAIGRPKGPIALKVHWGHIDFRNVQIRLLGE